MQATIEHNRQRDHERQQAFEFFESERRLTDEVTDMSERLAAPMRNIFEYEMRSDGELWFQGEPLSHIFDDGIAVAEQLTLENPLFATELIRRRLERQEYDDMRQLALGGDGDPDVLAVMSPIPDAVLNGVMFNGYDKERKKTLVRIFRRTDVGIEATSLSLDLSDRDGLNAIAGRFGQRIEDSASSEDILAMRLWGYEDELGTGVSKVVRSLYDTELTDKFGGDWYAGRRSSAVTDAKKFIEEQTDLVSTHMEELRQLRATYSGRLLDAKLEVARYNLAAALTRRLRGDADMDSLSDAGGSARASGERYDGDCPTGMQISAERSLSKLGMGQEWKYGNCRVCLEDRKVGECSVCIGCENADNRGKDLGAIHKAALRRKQQEQSVQKPSTLTERSVTRTDVRAVFGSNAEERLTYSVGSADTIVYDRRTGTAIAKKTSTGYVAV